MSGLPFIAGYGADLVLGDPQRLHPVAGFGALAERVETVVYQQSRLRGAVFAGPLVVLAAVAGEAFARGLRSAGAGRTAPYALLLWAALGGRSLRRAAERVATALAAGSLDDARAALPALVGRDVSELGEAEICRAVVESVAENTADAVVGPLVWGVAAGPAGVAAYRAVNTLDAMVGHRSPRYAEFGWAAARLDDVMSWPAARFGAALAALAAPVVGGSPFATARTVHRYGALHPSPNAGRIEAAFAGALRVQLGGSLSYAGQREERPLLGEGAPPMIAAIRDARRLSLAVGAIATAACALAGARR
jgi:adenosylcobinamide-phosphate synthase